MNLILEQTDQVECFTHLSEVFTALKIDCEDFDWYLSDIETNGFGIKNGWYAGKELSQLIKENDIQFVWGIVSAVEKGNRPNITDAPYADGNSDFWNIPHIKPQLLEALFEIVSWDSSAIILIGLNDELAKNFITAYSDAKELSSVTN